MTNLLFGLSAFDYASLVIFALFYGAEALEAEHQALLQHNREVEVFRQRQDDDLF